jgi:hypothetical protein
MCPDNNAGELETIENFYRALRVAKEYMVQHGIAHLFFPSYIGFEKVSFAENILPEDNGFDFQKFFWHYEKNSNKCSWLKITSYDRLTFAEHVFPLADALRNAGFNVAVDRTFKWDRSTTPHRCIDGWEFFIVARLPGTHPQPTSIPTICTSTDKRANRCIFELLHEAGIPLTNCSYAWTKNGFVFHTYNKKLAFAVKKLFNDCNPKVFRHKKSKARRVVVEFPQ